MRGYGFSKAELLAAQKRIEDFQRADMDPATLARTAKLQERARRQDILDRKRFNKGLGWALLLSAIFWLLLALAYLAV